MATHGTVKMENIPLPLPSKKVSVTSTVKEIKDEQVICKLPVTEPYVELDDRIICALPPRSKLPELEKAKLFKKFECEYPSTEPNVNRVTHPLPFPRELEEVIGWADAFVDRVASLTAARKAQTTRDMGCLATELKRLDTLLHTTEADLGKSRNETKEAKKEVRCLTDDLITAQAGLKARDDTIACLETDLDNARKAGATTGDLLKKAQLALSRMTKDRDDALAAFKKADAHAAAEHDKHKKAEALHEKDHKALEEEHRLLDAECKARKTAETSLAKAQKELAELKVKYEVKEKALVELQGKFNSVKDKLEDQRKRNGALQKENADLEKQLRDALHERDVALKKVLELKTEDAKNKDAICDLNTKLSTLQAEVDTLKTRIVALTKEKDVATARVSELEKELDVAKETIEAKQKDLDAARAEAAKWHTELKECEALRNSLTSKKDHAEGELAKTRKELVEKQNELAHAWEDLAEARSRKKADIDGYTRADSVSPARLVELEGFEKKVKEVDAELTAARKLIIQIPAGKKLKILTVEYGGQAYKDGTDKAILDNLYKHAANGTKFTVNNKFFGDNDPFKGHCKTFSITYLLEGENAARHLYGKERDEVCFCLPAQK